MKRTRILVSATLLSGLATLITAGVASAGESIDGSGPYPSLVEGLLSGVGGALNGLLNGLVHVVTGII